MPRDEQEAPPASRLTGAFGVKTMETVLIVVIALLVAAVGRGVIDPPRAQQPTYFLSNRRPPLHDLGIV